MVLPLISLSVAGLMGLKALRTLQERRAARAGFLSFGGDDKYQARNVHLNLHDACMVARIQLDMSPDEFDALIDRVRAAYLPWFRDLERKIEHRPTTFETPFEVTETYAPVQLGDTRILTKMIFCRADRVIVLLADHTYLGGFLLSQFVQLIFCERVARGVFPKNPYYPVLSELLMLAFLARSATLPRPAEKELFSAPSLTRRLYWKQSRAELEQLASDLKMNVLYVLIAKQIQAVMTELGRDRLRVTLPVSFEAESSFNTVGAIFINVKAADSFEEMAKRIRREVKRGQWQVSASNHIQRVLPTRHLSQRARHTADFTLTVVPQKTLPENRLRKEILDYEFTMDNIEYPVYAMAFIFEDHVHTSLMINTPSFDVDRFCARSGARVSDLTLGRSSAVAAKDAVGVSSKPGASPQRLGLLAQVPRRLGLFAKANANAFGPWAKSGPQAAATGEPDSSVAT